MSQTPDAALERRYQRLLAWYPPRHRAAHAEEMLGVLLAAAPDGQDRPRPAETANLLWGALQIWLRPRRVAEPGAGLWSDALAVFSVAAPLALVVMYAATITTEGLSVSARGGPLVVLYGFAFEGLALAVPFVVLGLRRTAGFVCCLAALLLAWGIGQILLSGALAGLGITFTFFSYATEAGALLGSPGPRRGWPVLSWPAWVLILAAGALAGVLQGACARVLMASPHYYTAFLHQRQNVAAWLTVAVVAAVMIAVVVWVVARRSALGRRVLVLFAILFCPWLTARTWVGLGGSAVSALVACLPPLILAWLVVAAVRRERREHRSAPDAGRPAQA